MDIKHISLGDNATSFYDASTGLYIADKNIHRVHPKYLKTKRAAQAIQGGHLVYRTKEEYEARSGVNTKHMENDSKYKDMPELSKKFMTAYDAGATAKQLADMFKREQLVELAEKSDIEVEDQDTKMDIVTAMIDAIQAEDDEE